MPRRTPYQLQWLLEGQKYVIFDDGRSVVPPIELDGPRWNAWLEAISSFAFQSRYGGSCTVRKERVQRGGTYWYAYRRQGRRMVKRYLARSGDLTLGRLEVITAALEDAEENVCGEVRDCVQTAPMEPLTMTPPLFSSPAQPLLSSRLHIPLLPVQHVSRPRLLALLQQGIQKPLTIVSAPAGSGKTTLLAEWASTADFPLAWISLEATDNDPLLFLSYLKAALARLDTSVASALQAFQLHDVEECQNALMHMLNALTDLLRQDAVIILDDYHELNDNVVHTMLQFLLEHLPSRLHLIIGTRVDPPLSLARLRASGQLNEVRTEELRFISSEVEALTRSMGLTLSHEATGLLEQRSEGWIAGIQLLSLVLRGQSDATAFLRTFRGTHRFFRNYVNEEVLLRQMPETQRFLLLTSVLDRMTGPLCDAVTELPGGQGRLEALLRANLFVSALDDTETWYRYHPLFSDALRAQLQKLEPELIPQLYLRASHWYEQQKQIEDACDYAFLAGDMPRAGQLVSQLLPHMVEAGRIERLKHWLSQLPPSLIVTSPRLYIAMPWLRALGKHTPEYIEHSLQQMEQYVQEQQQSEIAWAEPKSVLILFRALTALSQDNPLRAFTLVREALGSLTARETSLSQLLTRFLQIILSISYGARGDLVAAERILLDLSVSSSTDEFSLIQMASTFLLGELRIAQGQLRGARALYERAYEACSAPQALPALPALPQLLMSFTLMRRANVLYEGNHLSEAASEMERILASLPRVIQTIIPVTSRSPLFLFGLWVQARIALARNEPEAARLFLELVRNHPELHGELPQGKERPPLDVPALASRLALICGQMEDVRHWEETCGLSYENVPRTLLDGREIFAYLTLARALIARGRARKSETALAQALLLLKHWRDCALRLGFHGWLIEIQMLTALALQAQGKTRQSLTMLGPVLAEAEVEGYIRLFADEGQPMAQLLALVPPYTTASTSYIQQLQAAISGATQLLSPPEHSAVVQPLIEPLSAREREVLTIMISGASNQEIADRLVISLNTAKRHVKHILAKLSVTNRTQAAARARDLRLLQEKEDTP